MVTSALKTSKRSYFSVVGQLKLTHYLFFMSTIAFFKGYHSGASRLETREYR